GLDHSAQLVWGGQMAARGFVGPWQRIVEFIVIANHDVPQGKPSARWQYPSCFGVQARLVGHVHLNVLADHDAEGGVVKRKRGDVCLTNRYPVAQADESIKPAVG